MGQQENLRLYKTPQDTLITWARILNHTLSNLSTEGGYISIPDDSITDSKIDFGTGTGQVNASDIPIIDSGTYFPDDDVNAALQYLAGTITGTVTKVTTKTVTDTLLISDAGVILCNSAAAIIINLPTAVGNTGISYFITNINSGTVTIDPNGSEKIQGDSTFDLYQDENIQIISNGSNWFVR